MVCSCRVGLSVLDLVSACHTVWDDVPVQTNQLTLMMALEHCSVVQKYQFSHHCCLSYLSSSFAQCDKICLRLGPSPE